MGRGKVLGTPEFSTHGREPLVLVARSLQPITLGQVSKAGKVESLCYATTGASCGVLFDRWALSTLAQGKQEVDLVRCRIPGSTHRGASGSPLRNLVFLIDVDSLVGRQQATGACGAVRSDASETYAVL